MIPWFHVQPKFAQSYVFDKEVSESDFADISHIWTFYQNARIIQSHREAYWSHQEFGITCLIEAICGLHFDSKDVAEPYHPLIKWGDGSRTADISDFVKYIDTIVVLAASAPHLALKARLHDIAWIIERRRTDAGIAAADAYNELTKALMAGELRSQFVSSHGILCAETRGFLRRALQISRRVAWDNDLGRDIQKSASILRKQSLEQGISIPIAWYSQLDLDFGVSSPQDVASDIEKHVNKELAIDRTQVDLLRIAAQGYHRARLNEDKIRCLVNASEALALQAKRSSHSLLSAKYLSDAISQLHGLPNQKERRLRLKHELLDVQSKITEELQTLSQEFPIGDLVERIKSEISGKNLVAKLFFFASLSSSPAREELENDAKARILEHPLSNMFTTVHLDRDGKTIARSEGSFGDQDHRNAIMTNIFQAESFRRSYIVSAAIRPVLESIAIEHGVTEQLLYQLLSISPITPPQLHSTLSHGFYRFFSGDMVAAVYILTPQLEGIIRHCLKSSGLDTTIFYDDSQIQQDRTLSNLVEVYRNELNRLLSDQIIYEIENIFLKKPGPNLRNSVAHALLHDIDAFQPDAIYACWFLFRLCLLPLFGSFDEVKEHVDRSVSY